MREAITREEYRAGIETLLKVARTSTSGGRAAAQVLLSAYNGQGFQLDVTDLCMLGSGYYEAALNVIRGRVELMEEPHTLVENGDFIFPEIWEKWNRYSLENRHKPLCRECYGSGKEGNENGEVIGECRWCGGTGLEEV